MRSDEEILDSIIKDATVDLEEWPEIVKRLSARLDHIAHNSFPIPQLPPPPPPPPPPGPGIGTAARRTSINASQLSQATTEPMTQETMTQEITPASSSDTELVGDKENAPPPGTNETSFATEAATSVGSPPAAGGGDESGSSPPVIPESSVPADTQPQNATSIASDSQTSAAQLLGKTLPPSLNATLTYLITTLNTTFAKAPPHTAQRLAELLRNPTQHYRSLAKYLRALQRVMSVTSTVEAFPLPALYDRGPPGVNSTGVSGTIGLGNDESLGGALLTPIPWLTRPLAASSVVGSNSSDDGNSSDGGGGGATAMNGVTQGELIRQEQELGIVPVSQISQDAASNQPEAPGQTGPPELGAADLGPQPAGQTFPESPKRERTPEEPSAGAGSEEPQEKRQKTEDTEETNESKPDGDVMEVDSGSAAVTTTNTTTTDAEAIESEERPKTPTQAMDTSEDTTAATETGEKEAEGEEKPSEGS